VLISLKKNIRLIFLILLVVISSISLTNTIKITYKIDTQINSLNSTEMQGAWIIIAGGRDDHDKQDIIDNGCNCTYQILLGRGYTAPNIYYIGNTNFSFVDNDSTRANIRWAIETWAVSKCDATHGLGIYLFDHGGEDYMCLPGTDLSATNLDTYLDNFESDAECNRVIIVYEACHAGSFVNELSESNRIVLTATDRTHGSNVNGDWTWAAFSEGFWDSIADCNTIGKAFEDAVQNVDDLGYGGVQFPLIDDNHDQTGHEVNSSGLIPNGGDGDDALNTKIGYPLFCYIKLYIYAWPKILFFDPSISTIPLWCKVSSSTTISKVYARIIPPTWTPQPLENDTGDGVRFSGLSINHVIPLFDGDQDGNFTCDPKSSTVQQEWGWDTVNDTLRINFIAKSKDGGYMDMGTTSYKITSDGNPPQDSTPPTIKINTPELNSNVSGTISISAEADDDQSVHKISIYLDGTLLYSKLMPDYYPFESIISCNTVFYPNGVHNISAIAWDDTGNSASTSILVNFQNQLIPSFQIVPVIIGCILIILPLYIALYKKEESILSI